MPFAVLLGVAGLAVAVSFTRPFTVAADATVAAAFAGLAAALVLQRRPVPPVGFSRAGRTPDGPRRWRLRAALWLGPFATALAWELWCYFQAPRSAHPTLSSMLDAVDAHPVGRGLAYLAWAVLGWYLVTR